MPLSNLATAVTTKYIIVFMLMLVAIISQACSQDSEDLDVDIDSEVRDSEVYDAYLNEDLGKDFGSDDPTLSDSNIIDAAKDQFIIEEDIYYADQYLPPYQYIEIVDQSPEENNAGTPGVDICGVYCECNGNIIEVYTSELITDDLNICGNDIDWCSTDRSDPGAAEDLGESCEGGSIPSDYVSIGMNGKLSLRFGSDLNGCTVNIVEHWGGDIEGAEVFACRYSSDESSCISIGSFETDGVYNGIEGITHSFMIEDQISESKYN